MANTYIKYAPNVFLAKCTESHQKGDVIPVTTKRGKDNDSIVHNLVFEKDGFFYYSITRADGYNMQERAKNKAAKYEEWAASAEKKKEQYYQASREGADFLALGEPIKIGHHSEKRHRALIERNWNRMGKSVEMGEKAAEHKKAAANWEEKSEDINLSMPESLEYFALKLEEAKKLHEGLKNGTIERSHAYSLTYAKKAVKDLEGKLQMAEKLWGNIS